MEKFFLFNKIESRILHPITLNFIDDEITNLYIDKVFNFKFYISFSILELFISLITIIFSIISYYFSQSTLNNIRVFLVLLVTIFLLINLIFFSFAKNSFIYRKVLISFGTSVHIFSYKLLFYILLSINYSDYYIYYENLGPLITLLEMFFSLIYIIFIDDSFIIHILNHLLSIIIIFIVETFLNYYIRFSFIFFISFISSILVCLVSYFHQKFQKINWFLTCRRIKDIEYYAKLFLNNSFILVSFQKNEVFNFNHSIRFLLENSKLREDMENLIFSNREIEKQGLNNEAKNIITSGMSIIIKKLLFSKIKIKNENLSNVIKEQINNLESNEKNFLDKIDTFFSIIRENKEKFLNIYYLGCINFENIEQQYSVFIQVNPFNGYITYFGVALDFPIEVSQNLEILSKILILNSKITHEIKNPLAAIQTLVYEIKSNLDNQSLVDKLDSIFDYSEYMKYITKDFEFLALKLNNIREQKNITEVDIKKGNFNVICDFAVELIKNIWKNKNSRVLIKKEIDKDIPEYIYTDEIRVKQIIINLLSNSLKFTKMGSVTLVCQNYDNDYILIMVKDTGIGMKEEQVEKLNEEGTLFLKSNNNNKFGSGLGLSVVKDMVLILGKDFKVESKYNEGTRISFLLNKNNDLLNKEFNNSIIKNDSFKININGNFNNVREPSIINGVDSPNLLLGNNMKLIYNNSKTQNEQNTKRENFLLVKPNENYTIQTEIQYSKDIDSNFLDPKKIINNNKRRTSFNILNRARMSSIAKSINLRLPQIPVNENNIQELNENNLPSRKKIYALVVEDEQVLRNCNINIITKYFNERGIDVLIDENNDGIECIYKIYKGFIKEKKYQFIVTDEQMNTMNGNMMAKIIRDLVDEKRFYPIKIYSSSGNNFVDDNFKNNYEGIFSKPLTIENVASIFNDNVEGLL